MQISLAARLAYKLGLNGVLANIYGNDEIVSYLAGWLGDAIIQDDYGKTSFGGDDYISDLDAENIYRLILNGKSLIEASHRYYCNLHSFTRAEIFTEYISVEEIVHQIENYLLPIYDEDKFNEIYGDTIKFINSVSNNLNVMGDE